MKKAGFRRKLKNARILEKTEKLKKAEKARILEKTEKFEDFWLSEAV